MKTNKATKAESKLSNSFDSEPGMSPSASHVSLRDQRRGSRATNACEACKKRKTKCSGPPGPCDTCSKVATFCHFNMKLDTRRKIAYKDSVMKERKQYILEAMMQTIKYSDAHDVETMINLIRNEARPQMVAASIRKNIHDLQSRGIIPRLEVDDADVVSLGLGGLYSHRTGRDALKRNGSKVAAPIDITTCQSNSIDSSSATSASTVSSSNGSYTMTSGEESLQCTADVARLTTRSSSPASGFDHEELSTLNNASIPEYNASLMEVDTRPLQQSNSVTHAQFTPYASANQHHPKFEYQMPTYITDPGAYQQSIPNYAGLQHYAPHSSIDSSMFSTNAYPLGVGPYQFGTPNYHQNASGKQSSVPLSYQRTPNGKQQNFTVSYHQSSNGKQPIGAMNYHQNSNGKQHNVTTYYPDGAYDPYCTSTIHSTDTTTTSESSSDESCTTAYFRRS